MGACLYDFGGPCVYGLTRVLAAFIQSGSQLCVMCSSQPIMPVALVCSLTTLALILYERIDNERPCYIETIVQIKVVVGLLGQGKGKKRDRFIFKLNAPNN